jgi:hypothetical protein
MRLDHFQTIMANNAPRPNPNKKKSQKLCSCVVPKDLHVPGSKPLGKSGWRLINVFLAVICPHRNLVWALLDFSCLVQLHIIISCDVPWKVKDIHPNSPVSSNYVLSYIRRPLIDMATTALGVSLVA